MQPVASSANRRSIGALGLVLGALALASCTKEPKPTGAPAATATATAAAAPTAAPAASAPAAAAPAAAGDSLSGTVVETMSSGGYTYAKLDRGGTQVWVAGPETPLTVGARLTNLSGSLMTGFQSPSLNRTFDQIYFVGTFVAPGAAVAAPGAMAAGRPQEPVAKIELAPGGKTIAEIIAGKDALSGKPVVVRGKIVKVNNGILGRNWLHVQDGSGGPGTNDLTVTTSGTAARGDVVVVRGTVATNKDFGAGYSYPVLIEDATLASK